MDIAKLTKNVKVNDLNGLTLLRTFIANELRNKTNFIVKSLKFVYMLLFLLVMVMSLFTVSDYIELIVVELLLIYFVVIW